MDEFPAIEGTYDEAFAPLVAEFARGIADGSDKGAALAVVRGDTVVVDVRGGHRDLDGAIPWTEDTVAPVMSVGKAILATIMLMLDERGEIDLQTPIASYWPEFGKSGKTAVTPVHVLTHTAGLPFHENVPLGADWTSHDVLATSLEGQAPRWDPGSVPAYHSMTMGTLVDAMVRRTIGASAAQWLAAEIAGPRDLDVTFGLAERDRARRAFVADSTVARAESGDTCVADPTIGPAPEEPARTNDLVNSPRFEATEWPSINGFATAVGIARFYAALAFGGEGGPPLISPTQLERAITEEWAACEMSGGQFKRMGLGVNLGASPTNWFGPDNAAFGHGGKGGSTALADLRHGVAFGYVTSSLYGFEGSGPRTLGLSRLLTACCEDAAL